MTTVILNDPSTDTDYEITCDLYDIEVRRGRSRQLDEIQAGTFDASARNLSGNFTASDPGPYGAMGFDRRVTVLDDETSVFVGFTENIENDWQHGRIASAPLHAEDGLARLARQKLAEWQTVKHQLSGARISSVLGRPTVDTSWAASTSIDTGLAHLQGDLVGEGANVLNYLQLVARTEAGRLFVSGGNVLTFTDRYHGLGSPVVEFRTDGDGINFRSLRVGLGPEQFYDLVSVTREGGSTVTVGTGTRHLTQDGLLFHNDWQSTDRANHLYEVYSDPQPAVLSIEVLLHALSPEDRALVAGLELGDLVTLAWTPPGNDPVDLDLLVEGLTYTSRRTGRGTETSMVFQLGAAWSGDVFELDSDALGVLDSDVPLAW